MDAYEYRSSDLDFALFLADCDIRTLIPERWVERHPQRISTELFWKQLLQVEALVSPNLVEGSLGARKARYRHGNIGHAA